MSKLLKVLLFISLFTQTTVIASECEFTNEYKEARKEVHNELYSSFKSCIKSTRSALFWKEVSKCTSEGKGKNVGGGCIHISSYKKYYTPKDLEHCSILKPSYAQLNSYLLEIMKKRKIAKCK